MSRRNRTRQLPQPTYQYVKLRGGLDTETAPIELPPGFIRDSENFEIGVNGKYIRGIGYERFSGQPAPSAAIALFVPVEFLDTIEVDDVVTGQTSGESGTVVAVGPDYIVTTKNTGEFTEGETLEVSAVAVAEVLTDIDIETPYTAKLAAQFKGLAANLYRADIAEVPGEGSVLGVWYLSGSWYAVRNDTGGATAKVYRESASGWDEVDLGREIEFTSGGTTEIAEGATVEGATSGATATVERVILVSGTWAGGDAAGRLVLSGQTGTFVAENLDVGGNLDLATVAGDSTAITLLPSGTYRTVRYNFTGSVDTLRIYGVDGVNPGFEFDGAVWVQIFTGMPQDTPSYVVAHKNHLFYAFQGSVQNSAIGAPYLWNPVLGANEFGVGDTITGFNVEYGFEGGGTLAIYARNSIHMLYGNSVADFTLVRYRDEIGAFPDSVQNVGITLSIDDRGVANLRSSDTFGNFMHSTLSERIKSWIQARSGTVTNSCIVRDKNQYRVFFADGGALYITMDGRKAIGMVPQNLGRVVTCMQSTEVTSGREEIMFGSDDGFVYQMERGTSYDGDDIEAYFILHFNALGSPRVLKRWLKASIEAQGSGYSEFLFSYELGYASTEYHQPQPVLQDATFLPSRWDTFTWDLFFWDGQSVFPVNMGLSGSTENISFIIRMTDSIFNPIEFAGINVRHYLRRYLR